MSKQEVEEYAREMTKKDTKILEMAKDIIHCIITDDWNDRIF